MKAAVDYVDRVTNHVGLALDPDSTAVRRVRDHCGWIGKILSGYVALVLQSFRPVLNLVSNI